MDAVRIHGLELDCIVGILPSERVREQRVRLDISLYADLKQAGRSGRIALTTDYGKVAADVIALLRFRRYHLLEMAAEELAGMLLGVHANVRSVELAIEKPHALAGSARAGSVEIRRSRKDFSPRSEERSYGQRQVLLETREARLDVLKIAAGAEAKDGPGFDAEALRWVLRGTLEEGGRSLAVGLVEPPASAGSQSYLNAGLETATLFRCWRSPRATGR